MVCALTCAAFLCACAAGQEGKADVDGAERERTEDIMDVSEETAASAEEQTGDTQQEAASAEEQTGDTQQEAASAEEQAGGTQQEAIPADEQTTDVQDTSSAVQMQGLMQGDVGGIGSGLLTYTVPEEDGTDYKLCFFKEGGPVADFGKSLSEGDYYPLEMADYIFPDVRENNVSIGKFIEIYFFETITLDGDGTSGLAVVAVYDVNGETYYDTRIYKWNGTGYSVEEKLMQELNEKYSGAEEYPVEELYHLS